MLRFLDRAIGLPGALLLAACTGGPLMGLQVSDYRETFGWTGDQQLLTQILRAKDNAPLHFAELQTLGANDQFNASLQTLNAYGPTTTGSLQGTAGAQISPSFSLSSLEVQQFTQGILAPVGPLIIQQLLEEGVDRRLIFILFFSGYTENKVTYYNNLKCDLTDELKNINDERKRLRCYNNFYNFLKNVDKITRVNKKMIARGYVALTPMGVSTPWGSTAPKDIAGIDPAKYALGSDPRDPTKGIVYSVSEQRLALCYVSPGRAATPVVDTSAPICTRDRVPISPYRIDTQSENGLIVRSTYEVIEYLGQILSFQEKEKAEGHDRCVTLTGLGDKTCEQDVVFQVNPPRGSTLVSTVYNGNRYTIGADTCYDPLVCDHSAEVLKIVNLLINNSKNANIIPQVLTVRTVQ